MPTIENRKGRLEVRFIPDFFNSPAVYTLLATMAAAERSKLIISLLQRHIQETKHPAGNPEVQLRLIEGYLTKGQQGGYIAENAHKLTSLQSATANSDAAIQYQVLASDSQAFATTDTPEAKAHAESEPTGSKGSAVASDDEVDLGSQQDEVTSSSARPLSTMVSRWISE
jgi:hypothetical protein